MRRRSPAVDVAALKHAVLAVVIAAMPMAAKADCKLLEIAEFHVDPNSRSPIVDGAINGRPVKVLFDTGSSFSMIPRHEAERLGLTLQTLAGEHAYSLGGRTDIFTTQVKELRIDKFVKSNMVLGVAGAASTPYDVSLILGDDFFSQVDVEFDLPDNAVRLFEPHGCSPPQLVYWGAAYSQATLLPWGRDAPSVQAMASLNGKPLLAELDTGAGVSVVDATTASSLGVVADGASAAARMQGLGPHVQTSRVGRFDSFGLGDEKIGNVSLQLIDLTGNMTESVTGEHIPVHIDSAAMLVGTDFFRAHRVFLDAHDHLILFSYSGGPVFQTAPPAPAK